MEFKIEYDTGYYHLYLHSNWHEICTVTGKTYGTGIAEKLNIPIKEYIHMARKHNAKIHQHSESYYSISFEYIDEAKLFAKNLEPYMVMKALVNNEK